MDGGPHPWYPVCARQTQEWDRDGTWERPGVRRVDTFHCDPDLSKVLGPTGLSGPVGPLPWPSYSTLTPVLLTCHDRIPAGGSDVTVSRDETRS